MYQNRFMFFVCTFCLLLWACEDEYHFGIPSPKLEGVVGKWKAVKVVQVDRIAEKNASGKIRQDITNAYSLNLSSFTVTFDATRDSDGRLSPSMFVVENNGAHNFTGVNTGSWRLNAEKYPTRINLYGSQVPNLNAEPIAFYTITAPPKEGEDLKIAFDRVLGGNRILSYEYTFTKIPNNN
ncbi:MAG: DUF5004 domain-containing protein [Cytophagales bacterium]|nr:DUF5004 domain-containing protein [Cytophagales bacterium]